MKFLTENVWLLKEVEKCNLILIEELKKERLKEVKNILDHYYFKGKKLRPAITCLCSRLDGKSSNNIPFLAASVELIHIASLFHDDVVDDTVIRRNEKSSKSRYGNIISIYSGDYALCQGLKIVERFGNQKIKEEYVNTIHNMVRGELLAAINRFNYDITKELYIKIISYKTASLFQLSSLIGFHSDLEEDVRIENIKKFGWFLGIAYQIMDDLEDMIGFEENDSDLNQGYFALPFILFLNNNSGDFIIKNKLTEKQKKEIITTLEKKKLFGKVIEEINHYLEKSMGYLKIFENPKVMEVFSSISSEILKKSKNTVKNYLSYLGKDI